MNKYILLDIERINGRKNPLLITFPFAGGNAHSYMPILRGISNDIDILNIELPGRGRRMGEDLLSSMSEIIYDIWQNWISLLFFDKPFVLWGHSMGGFIAYNISLLLCREKSLIPRRLIISGCPPPHSRDNQSIHMLDSDMLWDYLLSLGGVPPEIAECEDIRFHAERYIRSDIKSYETTKSDFMKTDCINTHLILIQGKDDLTLDFRQNDWAHLNLGTTELVTMNGGHFCIFEDVQKMREILERSFLDR